MAREKIEVTVVRNYSKSAHEKNTTSGLYVEVDLPHYDIKKIVGAIEVIVLDKGEASAKAYLVGSSISHAELGKLGNGYEVTVIDAQINR